MIDLIKRNSESRTIHTFIMSFTTSNDHIYFSGLRNIEYLFYPERVTSLHRTSIVANSCHADHKVLGRQAGALVGNDPKVTLRTCL